MQVYPSIQPYLPALVRYVRRLTEEYKVAFARIQAECADNIYRIHRHDAEWHAQTTFLDCLHAVLFSFKQQDLHPQVEHLELPISAVHEILVNFSAQTELAKPVNYPCKSDMLLTYFQFLTAFQSAVKALTVSTQLQSSMEAWANIRGLLENAAVMLKSNQGAQLKSAVPENITTQLLRLCQK